MDLAHPLGIALGEVVVDRDDVDAVAGESVEVGRADGGQGLALSGLHLDDFALVQDEAAQDLHVEGPLAQDSPRRLADEGEGLGEQIVEALSGLVPGLELVGLLGKLLRLEGKSPSLFRVDLMENREERLDVALFFRAEKQGQDIHAHAPYNTYFK